MWPFRKKKNKDKQDLKKCELKERELESETVREIYTNLQKGYYKTTLIKHNQEPTVFQYNKSENESMTLYDLPVPLNPSLFRIRETYYNEEPWHTKLSSMNEIIKNTQKPKTKDDKTFLEQFYHNLNELANKSHLAYKIKNYSEYRGPAQRVFSCLERLVI